MISMFSKVILSSLYLTPVYLWMILLNFVLGNFYIPLYLGLLTVTSIGVSWIVVRTIKKMEIERITLTEFDKSNKIMGEYITIIGILSLIGTLCVTWMFNLSVVASLLLIVLVYTHKWYMGNCMYYIFGYNVLKVKRLRGFDFMLLTKQESLEDTRILIVSQMSNGLYIND